MPSELIFVFNADGSPLARVLDLVHKTLSPGTYACNLCRVTYGPFAPRKDWTDLVKSLPYRTVFLHKDEFRRLYPALAATALPAIFEKNTEGALSLVVSADEINRVHSVEELKTLLRSKLQD